MRKELTAWVEARLPQLKRGEVKKRELPLLEIPQQLDSQPVTGDAGFRCYYRLNTRPSLLAVDSPPEKEKNSEFVAIAKQLRDLGVRAPHVYAWDQAQGFLLVEDLGDQLYLPNLSGGSVQKLYGEAMATIVKMQARAQRPADLPLYDRDLLLVEMNLLREWFVPQLLGVDLTSEDNAILDELFKQLCDAALAQPQALVHRDYHSRNLLVMPENGPGVVDFQDAVWGACTYDLVSLLRDCYICWPEQSVQAWALQYKQQAVEAGLFSDVDDAAFLRSFDLMGLQRHIKVLGIFARLYLRDNKPGYLNDLPLVIHYTLSVAKKYPEFEAFVSLFESKWLPASKACSWYHSELPMMDASGAKV